MLVFEVWRIIEPGREVLLADYNNWEEAEEYRQLCEDNDPSCRYVIETREVDA